METCYKMFRREVIETIRIQSDGFSVERKLPVKICRNMRLRIYEIPISSCERSYAEGKKINWSRGFTAFWTLLKIPDCQLKGFYSDRIGFNFS